MDSFSLPPILLDVPRNAVLAIGLPLVLGSLSGFPTSKVVKGAWYNGLRHPPIEPPRAAFGIVWFVHSIRLATLAVTLNVVQASFVREHGMGFSFGYQSL